MKRLILLLVLLFSVPGFGQVKMSPGSVASTVPWGQITGGITVQSDLISYIYKRAHMICVSDYANIHSAIDVLSTGDILMIDTYAACSKQDTIPADVYLAVRGGKFIDPKTYRLFIRANMLLVGDTKIFRVYSDSSRITITNNDLNPIWFGADRLAGNIDSTTQAFKNMFGSIYYNTGYVDIEDAAYGRVIIPPGMYYINDVITVYHAVQIEAGTYNSIVGSSVRATPGQTTMMTRSSIVQTASSTYTMHFYNADIGGFAFYGPHIFGINFIDGTSDTTANGILVTDKDHFLFDNCSFVNYQGGYALYFDGVADGVIWGAIQNCVFKNNRYGITSAGMFNAVTIENNRFMSLTNSAIKLANNTGSAWMINVADYVIVKGNIWDIQNWSATGYKWGCIFQCGGSNGVYISDERWDTNSGNGIKFILPAAPDYARAFIDMKVGGGAGDTTIHITSGQGVLRFRGQSSGLIVNENTYPGGTQFENIGNVSGTLIKNYDFDPARHKPMQYNSMLKYKNHFYTGILSDSAIAIYGGKSGRSEPDFLILDPNVDTDFRRMFCIEGNSQDRLHDTTWVYTQNYSSTKYKRFGQHELHTRAYRNYWISGDTSTPDTLSDGTPNFYGTSTNEAAFGYDYYGVLSLGNPAGEFASYGGSDKNYIISKYSSNVPSGAKQYYGALYVSAAGEWTALDSSGNATPFSPHTPGEALPKSESGIDPSEWFFNSTNKDSIQISVNMFKVIEALEQVTGQQFIWKRDLKTGKSLRTFVKE